MAQPRGGASAAIYVIRRGWHIDVGFDAAAVAPPLDTLRPQFPGAHYLLFGFGDRRYLEAHRRGMPELLGAVWPGEGLILVTALTGTPAQAFGKRSVVRLAVTPEQARSAMERISASLQMQSGGPDSEGPGPYEGSVYLRSTLRYSGLHTCNTWAAEVLEATGLPVHSRGVLFASQLWRPVQRLAHTDVSTEALRAP